MFILVLLNIIDLSIKFLFSNIVVLIKLIILNPYLLNYLLILNYIGIYLLYNTLASIKTIITYKFYRSIYKVSKDFNIGVKRFNYIP